MYIWIVVVHSKHFSQNIHSHFNVCVERIAAISPFLWFELTLSFSLTFPAQTAKDETAYTQVSDKPEEPSETPANQPMRNGSYIAMSPVEAQKC